MNKGIIQFVKENPDMPVAEVCAKFNCKKQHVYVARYEAGVTKKTPKPPAKPKLKTVRKQTLLSKDRKIKELSDRVAELTDQLEMLKANPNQVNIDSQWKQKYDGAVHHIDNLEKQITGYKAVVNYLEHQLAKAA